MPEGYARLKRGEKQPLYAQATAREGTLTIGTSPAPTCTLYDSAGAALAGRTDVPASGYDAGAQTAPRVWHNLDTVSPAALLPGFYTLVFRFTALGSDGMERVFRPAVAVQVAEEQA